MKTSADINLFGIILLMLIIFVDKTALQGQRNIKLFYRVIFYTILTLSAEIILSFTGISPLKGIDCFNYFVSIASFLFGTISAYFWFIFILYETQEKFACKPSLKNIYSLPLIFLYIWVLFSSASHLIYYFNGKNQYIQGNLYYLQIPIYGYLFASGAISFIKFKKENRFAQKKNLLSMCLFSLIPLLGFGIDSLFPNSHARLPTVVIAIVMQSLSLMKKEILLDPLTKLNNRREFKRYLAKITRTPDNENIFLIFFDINNFKGINDTYGHVEGDNALIMISQILNSTFFNTKAFLSRYGGDEFAVIIKKEEPEILSYLKNIDASLAALSETLPYSISLSVGYSIYGEENATTIESLIKAADKKMYCNKEERKKNLCENNPLQNFYKIS